MERDEALELLMCHVTSPSLLVHSRATAAIMRKVAGHLGEDADTWEIIGLLHDIDYDLVAGDMSRHEVVRRHNHMLFGGYTTPVEIALQAADSASGLIIACALVKGGAIDQVSPKTVKKKFKDKAFAAGCERERIRMIESLIDLDTFYTLAIEGLAGVRAEIGLI
jgi:predicted hydrolase (HD superfamily)